MDNPIQAGDLVVIVKPKTCGCQEPLGHIHYVKAIMMSASGGVRCIYCGNLEPQTVVADFGGIASEIYRLKRIPPLSELEGEKRDEKLTEPA